MNDLTQDIVYLMQCSVDSEMKETIMSDRFYQELNLLNTKATDLEDKLSYLPESILHKESSKSGHSHKKRTKGGKKVRNPFIRSDSTIDVNVFPCEQLRELQVGLNTGDDSWCPICQTNCILHFLILL
jgi:hypothetical protein